MVWYDYKSMQIVRDFLETHSVPYQWIDHPAVFHVGEEPPELHGLPRTKNLLLENSKSGKVYMVIMPGEKRLDVRRLAEVLGVTKTALKFVAPDKVRDSVGVEPGHVSLFNFLHPEAAHVVAVFDEALFEAQYVGAHPNVNTASVFMTPQHAYSILALLSAESISVKL